MLNDVKFIKGQGGLGRPTPGQDYVSGLLFYVANGSLPAGFSTSNRVKLMLSLSDAESAGIKGDYADATSAAATYLVTAAGATGDTLKISVAETLGLTTIADYVRAEADTTPTIIANKLAAIINAGTVNHGYTASGATGTLTITAPKKFGVFLNTGSPLTVVKTGAIAGTITQFTGGVASIQAIWHYHISEFFRINPNGYLYLGFFAVPTTYDFVEVTTMQNFAVGAIRQLLVFKGANYATADFTALQTVVLANEEVHKPLSILYAADLVSVTDISVLADLATLNAYKVSDIISQDGGALGLFLFKSTGKSITNGGAMLGAVSLSKVSESIAWIREFNISDGTECEVLAFANGVLYSDASVSDNLLSLLNDRRHVFLRKFVGLSGSFFNDSHTAVAATSDYAYIENNRVIDKAIRGIYTTLLPSLNSPIQLNANGTIADTTIAYLQSEAGINLDEMVRAQELSAFQVDINPGQNVLATSKIIISVILVINGVARRIEVPIGYRTSL